MRNVFTAIIRKPKGKRALGAARCKWDINIKLDIKEII
jgi:hypothetical protein